MIDNSKMHTHYVETYDWIQCIACGNRLYDEQTSIAKNFCPKCGAKVDYVEFIDEGR